MAGKPAAIYIVRFITQQVEELCRTLPGLDCGSCGAPTCKTLAEDIVRGEASEKDCIFVLRKYFSTISGSIDDDDD